MRFTDIKPLEESELFEINMSPSSLQKLASQIDARAGMEFEMIVPDVGNVDDHDIEADYDQDERARSWYGIEDFFTGGDGVNSTRTVQEAIIKLQEQFYEWIEEQSFEDWQDEEFDVVLDWAKNNDSDEDVKSALDLDEDHEVDNDDWINYTNFCIENQNSTYEYAKDDWFSDRRGNADEENWLRRNFPYMSDIENETGLSWPYYTTSDNDLDINEVADEFESAVGKPVNASTQYHGGRREAGHYVVEPDGSLDPDDSDDTGLEFVSPPMSIEEMFDDLDRVRAWAKKRGCYTNESTGLHMNVSVPNWKGDLQKLDYVKLALLLGDEYVLNQFSRISNTYTKSAMSKVREQAQQRPEDVAALLQQMKQHLEDAATKVIHTGQTSKYTSINTKDGYVEFRSPGGNWLADLQNDPAKIKNTLLRFVVALDAAADPEKYREEYLKKLYKLLGARTDGNKDTVTFFADYVAGKMPKAALKSFIRQAQLERNIKGGKTGGEEFKWQVGRPGYGASIIVVAKTKEEAIDKALQPDGYPDWASARSQLTAKPIGPADKSPVRATAGEPQAIGQQTRQYELYSKATDVVLDTFPARNDQEANTRLNDYITVGAGSSAPNNFGVRPVAIPGSTLDLQRQLAQQSSGGGEFTGNWIIQDPQGRAIHRFGGIGNNQSDANRHALSWLRQNPEYIQQGSTVVPEMR